MFICVAQVCFMGTARSALSTWACASQPQCPLSSLSAPSPASVPPLQPQCPLSSLSVPSPASMSPLLSDLTGESDTRTPSPHHSRGPFQAECLLKSPITRLRVLGDSPLHIHTYAHIPGEGGAPLQRNHLYRFSSLDVCCWSFCALMVGEDKGQNRFCKGARC